MSSYTPESAVLTKAAVPEVEPADAATLAPDDATLPDNLTQPVTDTSRAAMRGALLATSRLDASEFAMLADLQVGKPYVLGAEASASDPSPAKFDCSELVEWLYARSGNRITDLAAAQYDATRPVVGEPHVGDLVFLRNNPARSNGIGHVAVITAKLPNGDWRIVEARGRAAGVVRTTLSYWRQRKHFAGVRRLASFYLAPDVAVTPALPPTIRRGAKGASVRRLQAALRAAGYRGDLLGRVLLPVDGDFGSQTTRAVQRWQKAHGLTADGVVGPKTWQSLGITL